MQETWLRSLGWEDPLEKEIATHSSILAWKISWTKEPGRLQSMGSQRVGYDWASNTHTPVALKVEWMTKHNKLLPWTASSVPVCMCGFQEQRGKKKNERATVSLIFLWVYYEFLPKSSKPPPSSSLSLDFYFILFYFLRLSIWLWTKTFSFSWYKDTLKPPLKKK